MQLGTWLSVCFCGHKMCFWWGCMYLFPLRVPFLNWHFPLLPSPWPSPALPLPCTGWIWFLHNFEFSFNFAAVFFSGAKLFQLLLKLMSTNPLLWSRKLSVFILNVLECASWYNCGVHKIWLNPFENLFCRRKKPSECFTLDVVHWDKPTIWRIFPNAAAI